MKRRTLCLLLAGMMALSVLSGCGGKTADDQPNTPNNPPAAGNDNVPNNEAPMVPDEDDWAYWDSAADAMEHEGQNQGQDQPEDDLPFPRDPRWDELKPGETAVQYYDIFIKSGMTVGEVVEAVESSDVYNDQFITWEISRSSGYGATDYTNLDNELTCKAPKKVFIMMADGNETLTENGYSVDTKSISIKCDDKILMYAAFPTELPGEEGTTYLVRDMPIILVRSYDGNNDVLTFMGTVGEIKAMNKDDLDGLLDKVFKVRDPDATVETTRESHRDSFYGRSYNVFRYTFSSRLPLSVSCNGYSFWSYLKGGEPVKGICVWSRLEIAPDGDKLYDGYGSTWLLDSLGGDNVSYYLYWAADDAG